MINVQVQRVPADRPGPDISDPLITSENAARERGRNEIDYACSHRQKVSGSGDLQQFLQPGALVEVQETARPPWRGQLKRWSMRITRQESEVTADQVMEIEREEIE